MGLEGLLGAIVQSVQSLLMDIILSFITDFLNQFLPGIQ